MPDWLWQFLASQFLWEVLLMLGLGGLLTWARAQWPQYANQALYGLLGMTCVAILWFTFTGHAILSKEQPQTTTANIETNIKLWADDFQVGMTKMPPNDNFYFQYQAVFPVNGKRFNIVRSRQKDHYLTISSTMILGDAERAAMAKLSQAQRDEIFANVDLELSRMKIGYQIATKDQTLVAVELSESIPITSSLSEDSFSQHMQEMEDNISTTDESVALAISNSKQ